MNLSDEDRDNNRQQLRCDQIQQIVQNGVFRDQPAGSGREQELEVVQSVPGAAEHTHVITEVLECKNQTAHREILHDEHQEKCRCSHCEQSLVHSEFFRKIFEESHYVTSLR